MTFKEAVEELKKRLPDPNQSFTLSCGYASYEKRYTFSIYCNEWTAEEQYEVQVGLGLMQPVKPGESKWAKPWPDFNQMMELCLQRLDALAAKRAEAAQAMDVELVNK